MGIAATLLLSLVLTQPISAAVPQTMSYQGVLTDNLGNIVPNGNYDLTFKIYTVPVAGAAIWTETFLGVPVSLGGFSVILGSTNPLTLAFDTQYYLGIAVNAGAELTPRVTLASTPYSLSLRIPFSGAGTSAGPAFRIQNQGAGYAITADPKMSVGTPTSDGRIDIFMNGPANPVEQIVAFSGLGGGAEYIDEAGNNMGGFEPDFDGAGGGSLRQRRSGRWLLVPRRQLGRRGKPLHDYLRRH